MESSKKERKEETKKEKKKDGKKEKANSKEEWEKGKSIQQNR